MSDAKEFEVLEHELRAAYCEQRAFKYRLALVAGIMLFCVEWYLFRKWDGTVTREVGTVVAGLGAVYLLLMGLMLVI